MIGPLPVTPLLPADAPVIAVWVMDFQCVHDDAVEAVYCSALSFSVEAGDWRCPNG
jgi:hypothetical protein